MKPLLILSVVAAVVAIGLVAATLALSILIYTDNTGTAYSHLFFCQSNIFSYRYRRGFYYSKDRDNGCLWKRLHAQDQMVTRCDFIFSDHYQRWLRPDFWSAVQNFSVGGDFCAVNRFPVLPAIAAQKPCIPHPRPVAGVRRSQRQLPRQSGPLLSHTEIRDMECQSQSHTFKVTNN